MGNYYNYNPRQPLKGFKIEKEQNGSQEGVPIPMLMGERLIPITWISRAYNMHAVKAAEVEKKSDLSSAPLGGFAFGGFEGMLFTGLLVEVIPTKKFYKFKGNIAGVICEGPVDELVSIVIDGYAIWPRKTEIDGAGQIKKWKEEKDYEEDDLVRFSYGVFKCRADHHSTTVNAPGNVTYWLPYSLVRGAEDYVDIQLPTRGNFRLYWGTQTQTVDPHLQRASDIGAQGNRKEELHPAYKGICYCVLNNFNFGTEQSIVPNVQVVVRRKPLQSIVAGAAAGLDDGQANPIAILCEVLTSQNALGSE